MSRHITLTAVIVGMILSTGIVPVVDASEITGTLQVNVGSDQLTTTGTGILSGQVTGGSDAVSGSGVSTVGNSRSSFSSGGFQSGNIGSGIAMISSASSSCEMLTIPMSPNEQNNPSEVALLQQLLNQSINTNIAVNGIFDQETLKAVKAFQIQYASEILTPWGISIPTGYVGFTTLKKLNELDCGAQVSLTPEQIAIIAEYKRQSSTNRSTHLTTNNINSTAMMTDNSSATATSSSDLISSSSQNIDTSTGTEAGVSFGVNNTNLTASVIQSGGSFFLKIVSFVQKLFGF